MRQLERFGLLFKSAFRAFRSTKQVRVSIKIRSRPSTPNQLIGMEAVQKKPFLRKSIAWFEYLYDIVVRRVGSRICVHVGLAITG